MAAGLMHYRHTHNLPDGEAALFRSATKTALDVVLPFVAASFARVYAGMSMMYVQGMSRVFFSAAL